MDASHLSEQLNQMVTGYWASHAIFAAAKLEIADQLAAGPRSADDLARATSTNADALYRLLRALASVGIFTETAERQFALTPMAELLQTGAPGSQRAFAMMMGDEQARAWCDILYSVQTSHTAFDKVFGKPIFDYLADHPDKGRIFDEAMTGIHGRETGAMVEAYDLSSVKVLADIGGGNGSQMTAILKRHPAMRGIIFDLPHVIERTRPRIEAAGLADRCELVGGSFFESVPAGADAYLMRHIIHDWEEEKTLAILRNCRRAMAKDARLLVIESVIPPGNEPFLGKFLDLVMLIIPGGKERTAEEYRALYEQAGFELTQIVPTTSEVSVIEGQPR